MKMRPSEQELTGTLELLIMDEFRHVWESYDF